MLTLFARLLGFGIAHTAARRRRAGGSLDAGLGLALLRDHRVPLGRKLLALVLGLGAVLALVALEVPVESVVAVLLSALGLGFDLAVDGLEFIVGPLLLASVFIRRLAPADLVARIRQERQISITTGTTTGRRFVSLRR